MGSLKIVLYSQSWEVLLSSALFGLGFPCNVTGNSGFRRLQGNCRWPPVILLGEGPGLSSTGPGAHFVQHSRAPGPMPCHLPHVPCTVQPSLHSLHTAGRVSHPQNPLCGFPRDCLQRLSPYGPMSRMHEVRRASHLCTGGPCMYAGRSTKHPRRSSGSHHGGRKAGLSLASSGTDWIFTWDTYYIFKHNVKVKKVA